MPRIHCRPFGVAPACLSRQSVPGSPHSICFCASHLLRTHRPLFLVLSIVPPRWVPVGSPVTTQSKTSEHGSPPERRCLTISHVSTRHRAVTTPPLKGQTLHLAGSSELFSVLSLPPPPSVATKKIPFLFSVLFVPIYRGEKKRKLMTGNFNFLLLHDHRILKHPAVYGPEQVRRRVRPGRECGEGLFQGRQRR